MPSLRRLFMFSVLLAASIVPLAGCDMQEEAQVTIQDLAIGQGEPVRTGMWVDVHYTGWLADQTQFTSTYDSTGTPLSPLTFQHGSRLLAGGRGRVIEGFDQGVAGMRVGGKRRVTIPPELGYGAAGLQDATTGAVIIPPDATLTFEIALVGAIPASKR